MHHTHAPSENENFPSAKPPARTSFLSFFPSHFRSSFRHFCHVLCDFYFSFQVPKPPVFAAFSLLQGILLLILFFLFLRQKNLISGESGMLPVKRTIKNNKFLYRQPCYGWRYFMLLLYIAHDISLVSLHAVSFEVVGCCSNLCN